VTYAVFAAIAAGMCLPYVVVGLLPGLVRFLPKPGAWMGTFKEMLGFVMLGTVVYLFTILHHEWFVPTLALLVGIWAACWWVGKAQETTGTVGFGRWLQAGTVAAAIGWGAFTLLAPGESVIEWEQPFSRDRIAELRRSGATVMVDFSADWCPTCKFNLAYAIETDRVKAAVEKNRVVPVLADWTDGSNEIKAALEALQSRSIPVLAIYPAATPGGECPDPIVLREPPGTDYRSTTRSASALAAATRPIRKLSWPRSASCFWMLSAKWGDTTSAMPMPMLNTRSISSVAIPPRACTQGNTAGTCHEPRSSTTCTVSGTIRARFSTSPPPVMWAMPWTTCLTR
jgi:thiol-disulfide isomerase/thioredoxin